MTMEQIMAVVVLVGIPVVLAFFAVVAGYVSRHAYPDCHGAVEKVPDIRNELSLKPKKLNLAA